MKSRTSALGPREGGPGAEQNRTRKTPPQARAPGRVAPGSGGLEASAGSAAPGAGAGDVAQEPGVAGSLGRGLGRREKGVWGEALLASDAALTLRPCLPPPEPRGLGPEASESQPRGPTCSL